jgi:hypothetical protein
LTIDPTNSAEVRSEFFYSGALPRITKVMPVLAALGTIALAWRVNWFFALGFALGCGIAYLNFYWLKRVVNALAERVTNARPSERGGGVFARFLLRYALIAATAYAILKISRQSLYGMLAGLFLPVAAIGCEAAYELYMALRRGC